ncbi:type II toxin-antitoxin system HicB family antitoxin [Desulfovibrio inopinatus]|uniref:type II toxin-antitoxin system HicB family antitoxin n=1 Tax=Desulfovibrio inopinatus TaxID=102109 RepID=UPI000686BD4A|nr:type II toxin-antitoxin system HicB family antitoxin [Desulfovibrio inopinatus]
MRYYIAVIHKQRDSEYELCFPDFPGCITAGADLVSARNMAVQALEGHIRVMNDHNEPLPIPTPPELIDANPDYKDGVMMLVPAKVDA